MKDNPFLDDLFPDAFRARKGRVARSFEHVPSTAAFRFSALSSRKKAEGVANNRAEVMLRIGAANVKSYLHVIKTADYVARHGKFFLIKPLTDRNCMTGKFFLQWVTENQKRDTCAESYFQCRRERMLRNSSPAATTGLKRC